MKMLMTMKDARRKTTTGTSGCICGDSRPLPLASCQINQQPHQAINGTGHNLASSLRSPLPLLVLLLSLLFYTNAELVQTSSAPPKRFTFAVIPKSLDNPFFNVSMDGCMDAARIHDVACHWTGPDQEDPDGKLQGEIVNNLLLQQSSNSPNNKIDGIAISVTNADVMRPIIERAVRQYNIPVVTWDSDAQDSSRTSYIGTNNTFLGIQLGKLVKQLFPNGGTYAIVSGTPPNLVAREQGLRQELDSTISSYTGNKHGDGCWHELESSPSDMQANASLAIDQMAVFAAQSPTVIVPVLGAPMRSGRWKELVDSTRQNSISYVSGDGMLNQLEFLDRGYAHGLVGQLPYEMGFRSIERLLEILEQRSSRQTPEDSDQNDDGNNGPATANTAHNKDYDEKLEFIGTNVVTHVFVPLELPRLIVDHNLIGDLRYVGYILFSIVFIFAIVFIVWTIQNRKRKVVEASQPIFLVFISVGVIILASALVPLSFDDGGDPASIYDQDSEHAICMSIPWLACLGFTIIFSALHAKLRRVNQLFNTGGRIRRRTVSGHDVLLPAALLLLANTIILIIWSIEDPLTYTRQEYEGTDGWGRTIATYGSCRSQDPIAYLICLALVNTGMLIMANWNAYQARAIKSEFSETKYVTIVMISMLQAILSGVPVLFVVRELPKAFYLVLAFAIFITCMAVLMIMFVPKIIIAYAFSQLSPRDQNLRIKTSIRKSMTRVSSTQPSRLNPSSEMMAQPDAFPSSFNSRRLDATRRHSSHVVRKYEDVRQHSSSHVHNAQELSPPKWQSNKYLIERQLYQQRYEDDDEESNTLLHDCKEAMSQLSRSSHVADLSSEVALAGRSSTTGSSDENSGILLDTGVQTNSALSQLTDLEDGSIVKSLNDAGSEDAVGSFTHRMMYVDSSTNSDFVGTQEDVDTDPMYSKEFSNHLREHHTSTTGNSEQNSTVNTDDTIAEKNMYSSVDGSTVDA